MPFSPVIEAFLAGQGQQNEVNSKAQDWQLKKAQLDQAMKEFDAQHKLALQTADLASQHLQLSTKIAHAESRDRLQKFLTEGAPPTEDQQINIPGIDNIALPGRQQGISSAPVSDSVAMPIPVGRDITRTTDMGEQVTIPRPITKFELKDLADKGDLADKIDLYKKTIGSDKASQREEDLVKQNNKLTSDLKLKDLSGEYAKQVADIRAEASKYGNDLRAQTAEEHGRTQLMNQLFSLGVTKPEDVPNLIKEYGTGVANGTKDISEIPAPLKPSVQAFLSGNGLMAPQGGKKFRIEIMTTASNADRLLNDMDNINKDYPAAQGIAGRGLNYLQTNTPILGKNTDIGQRFARMGDNIATYASLAGETPGMMRSSTLAAKAESAAPTATDTPTNRWNKKLNTIDLTLTKLNAGISHLSSPAQKAEYWKDVINTMPTLKQDMQYNGAMQDILENIIKTGTYSSNMLNKLKK